MTKTDNFHDEIENIVKDNKPFAGKKFFVGLVSWVGVSIFGLFLLVGLLWVAGALTDSSAEMQLIRLWIVYGMMAIFILALSISFVRKRKGVLVFKYAELPLKLGIGMNILILGAALVILLMHSIDSPTAATQTCIPLKDQISKIQLATVPIATDVGSGTGFAVNDGYTLLTAYHVIENAGRVYASYSTGEVDIEIIDTAPELDLALLRISIPQSEFLTLTKTYQIGDPVFSNGFPGNTFDAGQASLTEGIISRYLSNSDLKMSYEDIPQHLSVFQTDAAINPGNSGGALVNECGVVGVVTAVSAADSYLNEYGIRSEQGISYAVSSETAARRFGLAIR